MLNKKRKKLSIACGLAEEYKKHQYFILPLNNSFTTK